MPINLYVLTGNFFTGGYSFFFQSAVNIFLDQANCGSSEGNRDNPIMVSIFDRGIPLTGQFSQNIIKQLES